MKSRHAIIWAAISAAALLLNGCQSKTTSKQMNEQEQQIAKNENAQESAEIALEGVQKARAAVDRVEYKAPEDTEADCRITLKGAEAACEGQGAEYTDGVVRITKAGSYEITGWLEDGRIEVDASKDDQIVLILNGCSVACSDYAPLVVWQADETLVYLSDNTENTFTDGGNYYIEENGSENSTSSEQETPSAAIFSKDDLGFSGSGTLVVNASCNDGITGRDDLWFNEGTYRIQAADDGIVGKDSVAVRDGDFMIEAKGDGIKSANAADEEKGFVAVKAGKFSITSVNDGIQAETYAWLEGGQFTITTGGGSKEVQEQTGMMDRKGVRGSAEEDTSSSKGIKAGVNLSVHGGSFEMDCADDTLHSNDTLTIYDGTFMLQSGDDGIHADTCIVLADGDITISQCYEGIEAESILVEGGKIDLTAADDGFNAANGESSEGMDGPWGMEREPGADGSSSGALYIMNGEIHINAGGDGLDSNGSIAISGGMVCVDGPTNNGNGILDYDTEMLMTGGTLIGVGSSGMLQGISQNSSQAGITSALQSTQQAGTELTIKDSDGKEIVSYTAEKTFSAIVVSCSQLKLDETYDIYLNGEFHSSVQASLQSGGRDGMGSPNGGRGGMAAPDGQDGKMEVPNGGRGGKRVPASGGGIAAPDGGQGSVERPDEEKGRTNRRQLDVPPDQSDNEL